MDRCRLNGAQWEAVRHGEGPLLVLAGAGSGKTRVITHRIAHLIEAGVSPEQLLALSFTNKAAREVEGRVRDLIGANRSQGLTVSTFHSLGFRILREEMGRLGRDPRFTLLGEGEQRSTIRGIVRERGLPFELQEVQEAIAWWKNRGIVPGKLGPAPGDPRQRALMDAYAAYAELLEAQNAVDFDDLLLLPLQVFRRSPDCHRHWERVYRHILVDEYQDTNPVQFQLLVALAGPRPNVCAVGDDDQAIYGWRGADVGLILGFEEHFPGARVVLLEQNYRSTPTILAAAHAVAEKIRGRRAKRLWAGGAPGGPIGWIEAEDGGSEAEEVVSDILAHKYRTGRPWGDFAVLFRTNSQSRPFEEALRCHAVPHRVIGGTRFFDRKEVRDLMGYLQAIHNPRDEASLLRVANVPRRGLGPQALLALREKARMSGRSLREALADGAGLPPQGRAGARSLAQLLDRYGRLFRAEGVTAANLAQFIAEAGLRTEVESSYSSPQAVSRRLEIFEELIGSVERAPRVDGKVDLGLWIEKLSLDPPAADEEDVEDAVSLLTVHSAKGLEFPVVFLTGLEEGLLPHRRGGDLTDANLDEERRLCYVGMTRAKERLVLSRARTRKRRGAPLVCEPSRFLAEIPVALTAGSETVAARGEEEERRMARNFFAGIQGLLR